VWLAYKLVERQMGTVITPLKVINARIPSSLRMSYEMQKTERSLSLDAELRVLLKSYVATRNGCAFCVDIAADHAIEQDVPTEKVDDLLRYENSELFSERERAALAYVEAATENKEVADATFNRLAEHFSDTEIAEITWLNAMENYYNLLNRPLGIGSDDLCARRREEAEDHVFESRDREHPTS